MDVLVAGPVIGEVSHAFDLYWNSERAYPALVRKGGPPSAVDIDRQGQQLIEFVAEQADAPYLVALRNSNLAEKLRSRTVQFYWDQADVICDLPEKILQDFERQDQGKALKYQGTGARSRIRTMSRNNGHVEPI